MRFLIEYHPVIGIQILAKIFQQPFQKFHIYLSLLTEPKGYNSHILR